MSAYFAAAACHKIQAKLRKERRRAGSLADNFEPVSPEPPASQRSEDREFVEAVRERLGEDRRLLFDLAMNGLTWNEISAIVGGKPDALRMRLRREIAAVLSELCEEERWRPAAPRAKADNRKPATDESADRPPVGL